MGSGLRECACHPCFTPVATALKAKEGCMVGGGACMVPTILQPVVARGWGKPCVCGCSKITVCNPNKALQPYNPTTLKSWFFVKRDSVTYKAMVTKAVGLKEDAHGELEYDPMSVI